MLNVVECWCDLKKWLAMGGVWWISSRSRRLWGLKNWLTQMKYLWSQCKLICGICIVCISCMICKEFLNNWADSRKPVWYIIPSSWVFGNLFGTLSSFWRSKQLVISCFPWRTSPLTDNSDNVNVPSPQTLIVPCPAFPDQGVCISLFLGKTKLMTIKNISILFSIFGQPVIESSL